MATGRRRRGGCGGCGCLFLLLLLVIALWAAFFPLRLLERIGVRESAAERLLSGPPDEKAAQEMLAGMAEAGLSTRGVRLYVLPFTGSNERAAFAVLDAGQGFGEGDTWHEDALLRYLEKLAAGDAADKLGVTRVAVTYQDEQGKEILTLTGAVRDIRAFGSGQLTQEEFLKRLHANLDAGWFLREVQK